MQSGAARALTADLTNVIRLQRHTGTRVLIATQEPTLSPELIDLANVTFVHRFLSPAWYEVLKKHLAGANKHVSANSNESLFETIVNLQTGESLMFCPTALVSVDKNSSNEPIIKKLGSDYLRVNIRKRLTTDGGKSILASETTLKPTSAISHQIPMHIVVKPPQTMGNRRTYERGKIAFPTEDSGYSSASAPILPEQKTNNPQVRQIPNLPLPPQPKQPIPSARPNLTPVNPLNTKQIATDTKSKNHLPPQGPSLNQRIIQEGRLQMRKKYETHGWTKRSDIQWRSTLR